MWMMVYKRKGTKRNNVKVNLGRGGREIEGDIFISDLLLLFLFPVIQHELTLTSRIKRMQNKTEQAEQADAIKADGDMGQ